MPPAAGRASLGGHALSRRINEAVKQHDAVAAGSGPPTAAARGAERSPAQHGFFFLEETTFAEAYLLIYSDQALNSLKHVPLGHHG